MFTIFVKPGLYFSIFLIVLFIAKNAYPVSLSFTGSFVYCRSVISMLGIETKLKSDKEFPCEKVYGEIYPFDFESNVWDPSTTNRPLEFTLNEVLTLLCI